MKFFLTMITYQRPLVSCHAQLRALAICWISSFISPAIFFSFGLNCAYGLRFPSSKASLYLSSRTNRYVSWCTGNRLLPIHVVPDKCLSLPYAASKIRLNIQWTIRSMCPLADNWTSESFWNPFFERTSLVFLYNETSRNADLNFSAFLPAHVCNSETNKTWIQLPFY